MEINDSLCVTGARHFFLKLFALVFFFFYCNQETDYHSLILQVRVLGHTEFKRLAVLIHQTPPPPNEAKTGRIFSGKVLGGLRVFNEGRGMQGKPIDSAAIYVECQSPP